MQEIHRPAQNIFKCDDLQNSSAGFNALQNILQSRRLMTPDI